MGGGEGPGLKASSTHLLGCQKLCPLGALSSPPSLLAPLVHFMFVFLHIRVGGRASPPPWSFQQPCHGQFPTGLFCTTEGGGGEAGMQERRAPFSRSNRGELEWTLQNIWDWGLTLPFCDRGQPESAPVSLPALYESAELWPSPLSRPRFEFSGRIFALFSQIWAKDPSPWLATEQVSLLFLVPLTRISGSFSQIQGSIDFSISWPLPHVRSYQF